MSCVLTYHLPSPGEPPLPRASPLYHQQHPRQRRANWAPPSQTPAAPPTPAWRPIPQACIRLRHPGMGHGSAASYHWAGQTVPQSLRRRVTGPSDPWAPPPQTPAASSTVPLSYCPKAMPLTVSRPHNTSSPSCVWCKRAFLSVIREPARGPWACSVLSLAWADCTTGSTPST